MDIFRQIKHLRAKGDISGAAELERIVETRRASGRFFENDPKAKDYKNNLRRASGKLKEAEEDW
jgi:hypothetical protein